MLVTAATATEAHMVDSQTKKPPVTHTELSARRSCQQILSSCSVAIDGRCVRAYHPFDMTINCLLPLYPILSSAAHEGKNRSAVCLVLSDASIATVGKMVNTLFGEGTFIFVSTKLGACADELLKPPHLLAHVPERAHPRDQPYRALHRDILSRQPEWFHVPNISVLPPLHTVLIRRGATRKLFPGVEGALTERIELQTGRKVRVHSDDLPWSEILLIYSRCIAIVGYHGAGFSNAVFAPRSVCVIEITTYMREPCLDPGAVQTYNLSSLRNASTSAVQPWRWNRDAVWPWNPLIRWVTYFVPLRQILAANGRSCHQLPAKVMAIDMLIKTLRWVTLSDNDISNVAEAVRSCLSIPAAVNGLQLLSDAASEHSSMSALPQHGWRDRSTPPPPPYTHYVNGAWKPLYESVLKYMVRAAD